MSAVSNIEGAIKDYIMREFLPGEDPGQLTPSTPLMTGGILDSIATLKLVVFLENTFSVRMEPHETDAQYLDTIERIANLVRSKR
jgi:acyl carrier protein